MYIDRHEHKDVKQYWEKVFLHQMAIYEHCMVHWLPDENGNLVDQVYHGKTRRERHEELLNYAIKGGITKEPELLQLPNVIVQPHHGTATVETRNRIGALMIENLSAHFDGKPLLTPVP